MDDAGTAAHGGDGRTQADRAAAIAADVRRGAMDPDEAGRRLAALYRACPPAPEPTAGRPGLRLTLMTLLYLAAVVALFTAVVHSA